MSKFLVSALLALSCLLAVNQVSAQSDYQKTISASEKAPPPQISPLNNVYTVTCSSDKKKPTHCVWDDHYGEPKIVKQLSKKKCVKGKNWAYHSNRDLWVTNGCRAIFGS